MKKIILSTMMAVSLMGIPHISNEMGIRNLRKEIDDYTDSLYTDDELNEIKSNLLKAIEDYVSRYGKRTRFSSKELLDLCIKYDFDIVLALSQAHIESHFGTKGRAAKTNSVFNVGAYDSGWTPIKYRYKNPNNSIEPYLRLMTEKYLVDGKTVHNLLERNGFVNYMGKRYASFPNYERRIKKTYNKIKRKTKIDSLYDIYTSELYKESVEYHNIK